MFLNYDFCIPCHFDLDIAFRYYCWYYSCSNSFYADIVLRYVDIAAFAVIIVAVVEIVEGYCRYIVTVIDVTLILLLWLSLLLLLLLLQWATAVILLLLVLLRWYCCFCCRYCCCCWDRWGLLPLYCWCCCYVDFAFLLSLLLLLLWATAVIFLLLR